MFFGLFAVLISWFPASPNCVQAQTINSAAQGDNAVWLNSTTIAGSTAFVDASVFTGSGVNDLCGKIYAAIKSVPIGISNNGVVIDARGINTGSNTCANTPWFNGTNFVTTPTKILLPSGTILISSTWVIPNLTRVFGEGNNPTDGTTIQACKTPGCSQNFATGTPMIQFGTSSGSLACPASSCSGIAVQDVFLDGQGLSIVGIQNSNSGDLSYVDHVNLYHILGTALVVTGSPTQNSGPYSNIASSAKTGNSGTVCVKLQASSTRGIHGLTCTADGTPAAGILLDGSNNTLEDIHMEGYSDAILVGSNANAQGNVLIGVNGSDGAGQMTNVVHICGPNLPAYGSPNPLCLTTTNLVTDLAILGTRAENIHNTITNNLQDDVNATLISFLEDPHVLLYALGNTITGTTGGYSRYTTSAPKPSTTPPPVPTWGVGALGSSPPSGTCPAGALFSNTTGTSGGKDTLWVCVGTAWKPVI
jgi:hypothetical protein